MRSISWALVAALPLVSNGQWTCGPMGRFSLDERAKHAEYGLGARVTYASSLRWMLFADLDADIPRHATWDHSYGARGALGVGIAPFTRHQGWNTRFQQEMTLGATRRIGRIHRRIKSAHLYWGAGFGMVHQAMRYWWKTTDLVSGSAYETQGTAHGAYMMVAPVFGFRSREGKGRLVLEVHPVVRRGIDERGEPWELRYAMSLGYLWTIGT